MTSRVGPAAREAIFAQLAEAGRSEQVARRLTDAIILGVLEPGERLPTESELARRFGVALITVREALGILRENALVETRRGRDGGSFVTAAAHNDDSIDARLHALGLVDLADIAVYFTAILSACAERAAQRSTDEEGERLLAWLADADMAGPASARSNTGGFFLEVAVLSQSARLVREQIRLQAEFGPLLLLGLHDGALRKSTASGNTEIAVAIREHDAGSARDAAAAQVASLTEGLIAAKNALVRREIARAEHTDVVA